MITSITKKREQRSTSSLKMQINIKYFDDPNSICSKLVFQSNSVTLYIHAFFCLLRYRVPLDVHLYKVCQQHCNDFQLDITKYQFFFCFDKKQGDIYDDRQILPHNTLRDFSEFKDATTVTIYSMKLPEEESSKQGCKKLFSSLLFFRSYPYAVSWIGFRTRRNLKTSQKRRNNVAARVLLYILFILKI